MWKVQPLVLTGGCKQGAKYGWCFFFYVSNDLIMWGWRPENDSNAPPLPRRLPHTVMIPGDKDTWGSSQRSSKWNFNESGRGAADKGRPGQRAHSQVWANWMNNQVKGALRVIPYASPGLIEWQANHGALSPRRWRGACRGPNSLPLMSAAAKPADFSLESSGARWVALPWQLDEWISGRGDKCPLFSPLSLSPVNNVRRTCRGFLPTFLPREMATFSELGDTVRDGGTWCIKMSYMLMSNVTENNNTRRNEMNT